MRAKRSATRAKRSSKRSRNSPNKSHRRAPSRHRRKLAHQSTWSRRSSTNAARARSTRATLAIGASATNPSLPAPVVRSHRFHHLHRRQALELPAPRWPSPRDYPKRRPRRRRAPASSSSPTSTNPPRTSPFLPSRRTHHHRPIAPTPSIEAWRTLHLTIARAFERSSPRTFDESRAFFASSPSRATIPRVPSPFESPSTRVITFYSHTRASPRLVSCARDRPRPASRLPRRRTDFLSRVAADVTHPHSSPPATTPARDSPRETLEPSAGHPSRVSEADSLDARVTPRANRRANDRIDESDRRRMNLRRSRAPERDARRNGGRQRSDGHRRTVGGERRDEGGEKPRGAGVEIDARAARGWPSRSIDGGSRLTASSTTSRILSIRVDL